DSGDSSASWYASRTEAMRRDVSASRAASRQESTERRRSSRSRVRPLASDPPQDHAQQKILRVDVMDLLVSVRVSSRVENMRTERSGSWKRRPDVRGVAQEWRSTYHASSRSHFVSVYSADISDLAAEPQPNSTLAALRWSADFS